MRLKEIFKALQDNVPLERQLENGKWYPIKNTYDIPGANVSINADVECVRIAKEYVVIDGVSYEKPVVCKTLDHHQEYHFVGHTGMVHTDKYCTADQPRLHLGNAYPTGHDANLAAEIIKAIFADIAKQS